MGGLARRATYLKQLRKAPQPVILLDGGDIFGPKSKISGLDDMLRAEYLIKGMNLLKYDVVTLGEQEFRFGEPFLAERLSEASFATVSSNIYRAAENKPYVVRYVTRNAGEYKIGVVGVIDDQTHGTAITDATRYAGVKVTAKTAKDELNASLSEMGAVDLAVVLAHMSWAQAQKLAQGLSGVQVMIVVHDPGLPKPPQNINGILLMGSGFEGQNACRLHLRLGKDGNIVQALWRAVELDETFADDKELAALFAQYTKRLKDEADKVAAQIPQAEPENGGYVGSKPCVSCHPSQVMQWTNTEHAAALDTLVGTNRDYDPSCLVCHTTGFGYRTGFVLPDRSANLDDVQCESCHGPARDHVNNPVAGWSKDPKTMCVNCHVPKHSPDFDITTYLPQVTH